MNSYRERKKKFFDKQKKLMIQKLMSSFAITVVVVVIAVTIVSKIPKAEIVKAEAFGSDVYYEVKVTDDDYKIISGSLYIVAYNATESHEISLELGLQTGHFGDLKANTDYEIVVNADYGYGKGILASSKVTTSSNYGGRITNWQEDVSGNLMNNEILSYNVYTSYNDLKQEIQSVVLKYAYVYQDEITDELYIPDSSLFTVLEITSMQQTTLLSNIYNENIRIYLILEATLITSETIILDQKYFDTPLKLYSSLYISDVGPNYLIASLYADYYKRQDITYIVNLIRDGEIIETKTYDYTDFVSSNENEYMESQIEIVFNGLPVGTEYHLQLIAMYPNLDSGIKEYQELYFFDVATSPSYKIDFKSSKTETTINLQIDLYDPSLVFSDINYSVFKVIDGVESYYSNGTISMEYLGEERYQNILEVIVDPGYEYKILIYATKTVNPSIKYNWCLIKELTY